jgi:hypothetical protein
MREEWISTSDRGREKKGTGKEKGKRRDIRYSRKHTRRGHRNLRNLHRTTGG